MEDDYCRPVDLFTDRLINFALLRIAEDLSYFYLRTHHVLVDGYGANNIIRHVAAVYSGDRPHTGEVDFSAFALLPEADRKYQQSSRSTADAEYWKTVVRGRWTSPTWRECSAPWRHGIRWCASWCARTDSWKPGKTGSTSRGWLRRWRRLSRKRRAEIMFRCRYRFRRAPPRR